VIELVRDRASREPLSPWPELHQSLQALLHSALQSGVSFARAAISFCSRRRWSSASAIWPMPWICWIGCWRELTIASARRRGWAHELSG